MILLQGRGGAAEDNKKLVYIYIYIYIYICILYINLCIYSNTYTRVDPCIKYTRSKLDTGRGGCGLSGSRRPFVSLLSRPALSSLVLSPSALAPMGLKGLSWSSSGALLGPSWTSLGPLLGAILGLLAALGAPGSLLGFPWVAPPGTSSWAAPVLGLSWASPGPFWGALEGSGVSCGDY